ncbi:hypothetical protein RD792_005661, partial [Penstemon davidsonii]
VNLSDRLPKGKRAPRKPKPKNLSKCDSSGIKPDNYDMDHFHWMEKMIECPVYHPSKEEFEDPLAYVHKISPEASKFGTTFAIKLRQRKVIPPLIPSNPAGIVLMNEKIDFKFTTKVQPLRLPKWENGEKGTFYMSGSINYHHCGAPKTWYGVPGYSALRFENVVRKNIYNQEILSVNGEDTATFDLLSEKTTMFSPKILLQNDVPVYKAVQMPGEFVITFPQAYHAGFSHGFNCGEAVNFATGDWFSFGLEATTRYALLKRMPIIPFEELLYKEAKLLSNSSSHNLKVSFAFLMRLHHVARWFLKKFRKSLKSISVESQDTIFCFISKRECYVAYVVCKCNRDPICLFHEREICNCRCGKSCGLYLREDIQEMELVADMFEEEEEVHEKVQLQLKRDPFFLVMQNLSTSSEFEYIPSYSEKRPCKNQNRYKVSVKNVPKLA